MEVGGYPDSVYLACADIHLSWEMMIQTDGTFHCNGPEASSYFQWVEVEAFVAEFVETRSARRVPVDGEYDELNDLLVPRVASNRRAELCDQYQQLDATDGWAVLVGHSGQRHDIWLANGEAPEELKGFVGTGQSKPFAELRADLQSPYSSRRYKAVCQIYNTDDPAAAPLFLMVATDPTEQISLYAVMGLGRLRCREAIPVLGRIVREDGRDAVVSCAIQSLSQIGGADTFSALIAATRRAL